jgi:hypothetical protein
VQRSSFHTLVRIAMNPTKQSDQVVEYKTASNTHRLHRRCADEQSDALDTHNCRGIFMLDKRNATHLAASRFILAGVFGSLFGWSKVKYHAALSL